MSAEIHTGNDRRGALAGRDDGETRGATSVASGSPWPREGGGAEVLVLGEPPVNPKGMEGSTAHPPAGQLQGLTATAAPPVDLTLPLHKSVGIAIVYMLGSVFFFLLIRYSKLMEARGLLTYDSAAVVFFTELTKLCISVALKFRHDGIILPIFLCAALLPEGVSGATDARGLRGCCVAFLRRSGCLGHLTAFLLQWHSRPRTRSSEERELLTTAAGPAKVVGAQPCHGSGPGEREVFERPQSGQPSRREWLELRSQSRRSWAMGVPYIVPAFIYAVYNNLTYFNLARFDPGTYQIFMQTRILFTGFLFTVFLKQHLSVRKWLALILLMMGVILKYIAFPGSETGGGAPVQEDASAGGGIMGMVRSAASLLLAFDVAILVVLLQALLSSLAGVYNEYVLKKDAHLSIHEQNFFMYFFSLLFNVAFGLLGNPQYYTNFNFVQNFHVILLPIVISGAVVGISAAFILKYINVIVKAFASAGEVLLTSALAAFLLGEPLTAQDFGSAVIVMTSVYVYYSSGWGDGRLAK